MSMMREIERLWTVLARSKVVEQSDQSSGVASVGVTCGHKMTILSRRIQAHSTMLLTHRHLVSHAVSITSVFNRQNASLELFTTSVSNCDAFCTMKMQTLSLNLIHWSSKHIVYYFFLTSTWNVLLNHLKTSAHKAYLSTCRGHLKRVYFFISTRWPSAFKVSFTANALQCRNKIRELVASDASLLQLVAIHVISLP